MNSLVALQSTRDVINFFSTVSMVSISTFDFSEVGSSSIAAIMNFLGSNFSHLGQWVLTLESAVGAGVRNLRFCISWASVSMSFVLSMYRISKQLQEDNEGMQFIRCPEENPGVRFLLQWMGSPPQELHLVSQVLFLTLLQALWF